MPGVQKTRSGFNKVTSGFLSNQLQRTDISKLLETMQAKLGEWSSR